MTVDKQKDILLSVKPSYANLIVDGIKTIELRRRFPEEILEGTRCLIYSTSPIQKVIGECKIAKVSRLKLKDLWNEASIEAMISWSDFSKYFSNLEYGYAVQVYGNIRYDEPKALDTATGIKTSPPQSYRYIPVHNSPIVT